MVMGGVIMVNVIMIPARVAQLTKRRRREGRNCIHTYFVFNYWYFAGLYQGNLENYSARST